MKVRQLLSLFAATVLFSVAPITFAQDYTPSAAVTALIVEAQADGAGISDAEAAAIAQAVANDGGNAAAVATTLNTNGASSAQVAAGLATVGQTQGQIAATLTATGVVDNDGDAAAAAATGTQAAVAAGNAVVVTNTVAAANNANLTVNGSGLITDANGRAVVAKTEADQIFLVIAVLRNNAKESAASGQPVSSTVANSLRSLVSSNPALSSVSTQINDLITFAETNAGNSSASDDAFNDFFDREAGGIISSLPPGTITSQS